MVPEQFTNPGGGLKATLPPGPSPLSRWRVGAKKTKNILEILIVSKWRRACDLANFVVT